MKYLYFIILLFVSSAACAANVESKKSTELEGFSSSVYPGEWATLFTKALELFNFEVGKDLNEYQIEFSKDSREYVIAFFKKNSLKASVEYPSYYVISNKNFEIKERVLSKGSGHGLIKRKGDGGKVLPTKLTP